MSFLSERPPTPPRLHGRRQHQRYSIHCYARFLKPSVEILIVGIDHTKPLPQLPDKRLKSEGGVQLSLRLDQSGAERAPAYRAL